MAARVGLIVLGVSQIALGLWMVIGPGSFFTHLGAFGVRNDHYIRDYATFAFALGVVALVAVRRASWRAPVLTFAALQFTLHAINHVRDANKAFASTSGVGDAVSIAVGGVILAALAWLVARTPDAG